ncbi:DNA-binding transcriptional ArsR family regulator [Natronocella acetinitrilica]|uniref:DNA-binding transcriptional ArsR family regulator n=1 Tax=Natronocella acetinitrilica TaxID=414046 RepID=A0AAE3KD47_9GAMM|nr:metalloregulator ArsR/SmtB family transcription factor [Natronocella acetinitrilica]MCP1676444.1 DNA-binding transcriptional ArsR family regulator [Natronocella acetinitrilica]
MTLENASRSLAALGNPVRLSIFRLLVQAGTAGLNVGDIQRHMEIPASTLSHHLSNLAQAGLVQQTRQGREIICTAEFKRMRDTVDFLTAECCQGVALRDKAS